MPGREYGQYGQYHNYISGSHSHSNPQDAKRLHVTDLKICDLCGALNLVENSECLVCRWSGHFEQRAEILKIAIELMERRHGRLEISLLTNDSVYREPQPRATRSRLRLFLLRLHNWFFG